MKLKTKIIIAAASYVIFMAVFIGGFLPVFYETVGANAMIDAYLADFSKSTEDIKQLIVSYGIEGRRFMPAFFIADSLYIVVSVLLFSFSIEALTKKWYLKYIAFITGFWDTLENLVVLYTTQSMNMKIIVLARVFASIKAVFLFLSLGIIISSLIKLIIQRFKHSYKLKHFKY